LLLCAVFELGAGFTTSFRAFLALRSLFGIAMGGVWGLASATALENLPVEARGLGSGVLQQGYAFGYLIAAVMNLRLVPHSRHTWRTLFWASAAISAFAAFIRALVPESEVFLRAKALEREKGSTTGKKTRRFIQQANAMLKKHWLLCIYAVLLMTGTWMFCRVGRLT
jgi:SHS family lactate transporter-like MFS transporter